MIKLLVTKLDQRIMTLQQTKGGVSTFRTSQLPHETKNRLEKLKIAAHVYFILHHLIWQGNSHNHILQP